MRRIVEARAGTDRASFVQDRCLASVGLDGVDWSGGVYRIGRLDWIGPDFLFFLPINEWIRLD